MRGRRPVRSQLDRRQAAEIDAMMTTAMKEASTSSLPQFERANGHGVA